MVNRLNGWIVWEFGFWNLEFELWGLGYVICNLDFEI